LSTLPYFHDIITNTDGLKSWVPVFGLENLLTDANDKILGFSTYRVFLYTFLIFLFTTIGWAGWYRNAKTKYYRNGLFLVFASGAYHVALIVLNIRRTILNDLAPKLILLGLLFLMLGYFATRMHGLTFRKVIVYVILFMLAILPFLHDVITDNGGTLRPWIPNFGIEAILTDSEGLVRGLRSYRLLIYLFSIYLLSHLGWIGWFMDSRGKRYRPFLLIPVALSLYQVIVIVMSWRETEFNSPSIKLYVTLGLGIILAINFFYYNKYAPRATKTLQNTKTNENQQN
tara:strand:+ start:747 stop:1604 length:858 start_codon:yes stop_codon:yes gene_type:complete